MTRINEISKGIHNRASSLESSSKGATQIWIQRLFERLRLYLKIGPQRILDLGCGPGHFARIILVVSQLKWWARISAAMLWCKLKRNGWFRKWPLVAADMHKMPFVSGAFDLVFANQVIHWADSLPQVLRELNRVMNVNGFLCLPLWGLIPSKK